MNNLLVGPRRQRRAGAHGRGCTTRPSPAGRAVATGARRPTAGPRPGMSGVHTGMTNTRNTPVEALERSYRMRVRR